MSGLLLKYLHLTTDENNALPPGDAKRACSVIAIPPLNEVRFDGYNLIEVLDDGKTVFKTQITGNAYLMTESGKTINTFTPSVFERVNLVELHDKLFLKRDSAVEKLEQWSQLDTLKANTISGQDCHLRPAGNSIIYPDFFKDIYVHNKEIRFHYLGRIYKLGEKVKLLVDQEKAFTFDADAIQHLWTVNGLKNVMDPGSKITYDVKSIVAPYAIDQGEMKDFVTGKCEEKGAHFNFILNEGRRYLTFTDCFRFPGIELADSSVKIITDAEDKILNVRDFNNLVKLFSITSDFEYYITEDGSKTKIHALLFRTKD